MKCSIIIGTLNHLDDCLKPCCEAIINHTDLHDTEVIIVANGCTDGTREYVESLGDPFKLIWFDEPLGYAKANNAGIIASTGEYIVLLNNDAFLLGVNWFDMLISPFSNPKVGITGPTVTYSPYTNMPFAIFFCAMIKREVFVRIGLLNTEYEVGAGEDIQFGADAIIAGYDIVQVPGASVPGDGFMIGGFPVYHRGECTVNDNPEWNAIFERNMNKLSLKYVSNETE